MSHSKPVFPQTYGHSVDIKTSNGSQPAKTVAELAYTVAADPDKDGFFIKTSVLLTDAKGEPFEAYGLTVKNDLTLIEERNNKSLFGLKDCHCTINGKVLTKYFDVAFEVLELMAIAYRPVSGSSWIEPISVFLSEILKVSTLIDGDRSIDIDEIINVFAYCYDVKEAGKTIIGSKFLTYCQQFADIAITVEAEETIGQ